MHLHEKSLVVFRAAAMSGAVATIWFLLASSVSLLSSIVFVRSFWNSSGCSVCAIYDVMMVSMLFASNDMLAGTYLTEPLPAPLLADLLLLRRRQEELGTLFLDEGYDVFGPEVLDGRDVAGVDVYGLDRLAFAAPDR